jgi:hypothetical protein
MPDIPLYTSNTNGRIELRTRRGSLNARGSLTPLKMSKDSTALRLPESNELE